MRCVEEKHEGVRMGSKRDMASSCFSRPFTNQPETYADDSGWSSQGAGDAFGSHTTPAPYPSYQMHRPYTFFLTPMILTVHIQTTIWVNRWISYTMKQICKIYVEY